MGIFSAFLSFSHTLFLKNTTSTFFCLKAAFFGFHKHLIFSLIHKFSFHYWQAIGLRKLVVDQRLSSVFYKFVHFYFDHDFSQNMTLKIRKEDFGPFFE